MTGLFGPEAELSGRDEALIAAYAAVNRTLDDLPYTDDFEKLLAMVLRADAGATRQGVFRQLHTLRKASRLPRLGRGASHPPAIEAGEEEFLAGLVAEHAGTLGRRDQLPYDERFALVHAAFAERTGRSLSEHDLWRLIAKLAK